MFDVATGTDIPNFKKPPPNRGHAAEVRKKKGDPKSKVQEPPQFSSTTLEEGLGQSSHQFQDDNEEQDERYWDGNDRDIPRRDTRDMRFAASSGNPASADTTMLAPQIADAQVQGFWEESMRRSQLIQNIEKDRWEVDRRAWRALYLKGEHQPGDEWNQPEVEGEVAYTWKQAMRTCNYCSFRRLECVQSTGDQYGRCSTCIRFKQRCRYQKPGEQYQRPPRPPPSPQQVDPVEGHATIATDAGTEGAVERRIKSKSESESEIESDSDGPVLPAQYRARPLRQNKQRATKFELRTLRTSNDNIVPQLESLATSNLSVASTSASTSTSPSAGPTPSSGSSLDLPERPSSNRKFHNPQPVSSFPRRTSRLLGSDSNDTQYIATPSTQGSTSNRISTAASLNQIYELDRLPQYHPPNRKPLSTTPLEADITSAELPLEGVGSWQPETTLSWQTIVQSRRKPLRRPLRTSIRHGGGHDMTGSRTSTSTSTSDTEFAGVSSRSRPSGTPTTTTTTASPDLDVPGRATSNAGPAETVAEAARRGLSALESSRTRATEDHLLETARRKIQSGEIVPRDLNASIHAPPSSSSSLLAQAQMEPRYSQLILKHEDSWNGNRAGTSGPFWKGPLHKLPHRF